MRKFLPHNSLGPLHEFAPFHQSNLACCRTHMTQHGDFLNIISSSPLVGIQHIVMCCGISNRKHGVSHATSSQELSDTIDGPMGSSGKPICFLFSPSRRHPTPGEVLFPYRDPQRFLAAFVFRFAKDSKRASSMTRGGAVFSYARPDQPWSYSSRWTQPWHTQGMPTVGVVDVVVVTL
jgi:hypothetical protein